MQIETKFAFPDKVAQIKHMFRDSRGHVVDTPLNRAIMLMTASDPNNYLGTDKNQNQWYIYTVGDNQYWVKTRNGVVMDCGMNNPPIEPDEIFDRKDKK